MAKKTFKSKVLEKKQQQADEFVKAAITKTSGLEVLLDEEVKTSRVQEDKKASLQNASKNSRTQELKTSIPNETKSKNVVKISREQEVKNSRLEQTHNTSSSQELKNSRHQEEAPSKKAHVYEKIEKCNFTIPESLLLQLDDITNDFKKEYRKLAPNKNHYIIVALRRLFQDIEGEERALIIEDLLALRRETIERKKPKRR